MSTQCAVPIIISAAGAGRKRLRHPLPAAAAAPTSATVKRRTIDDDKYEQHRPTGSEQSQVICAHTGAAPHSHTCLHVFPSLCSLGPHRAVPRRQCYVAAAITPMMVTVTRTIYACNTVKQRQTINSKTLQYITIESEFNHSYAKIHTNRPMCKCFDCFPATW